MIYAAGMVLLTGLAGFGGSVMASTPDGETPANEGVCDLLQNATPGLYGLCVAYCEAQDLDILGDKEPPNTRILANYDKKKQAGDPDMPCVQTPCPCWTIEEIDGILATGGLKTCTLVGDFAQIENQVDTINGVAQRARIDSDRLQCRYLDRTTDPRISRGFKNLTAEEAASCASHVTTACSGL